MQDSLRERGGSLARDRGSGKTGLQPLALFSAVAGFAAFAAPNNAAAQSPDAKLSVTLALANHALRQFDDREREDISRSQTSPVDRKQIMASDVIRSALASGDVDIATMSIDTVLRAHAAGFDGKSLSRGGV